MASTPVWKLGVGAGTSCAVLLDDTGWCWGDILLNDAIPAPSQVYTYPVPILDSNDAIFYSVAAGERAACGILGNGTLDCWGSATAQSIDSAGLNDWTYVSLGNNHACGIVGFGEGLCWGICAGDECGPLDSSTLLSAGNRLFRIPNPNPATPWVQIETSNRILGDERFNSHTCGVQSDGTAWCWGDNAFGQLGIGTREPTSIPTKVSGPNLWRDICTGRGYTCGIDTDGLLLCWGLKIPSQSIDENGSLFEIYGTVPIVLDPDRVTRDIWYTVSCGYFHACAIKATDGAMYCWGENNVGQLGDGTTEPAEIPKLVKPPTTVIWEQSGAGESHTCGMPIDMNQVYCWGSTENGQLGIGDTDEDFVTVPRLLRFSIAPPPPPPSPPVPNVEPSPSVPVQSIPPPPPVIAPAPAPTPEEASGSSVSTGVIVGAAVGGVCVLCILGLLAFFFIRRRKKKKKGDDKQASEDIEGGSGQSSTGSEEGSLDHPGDGNPQDLPVNDDDNEPIVPPINPISTALMDASRSSPDEEDPVPVVPSQFVEEHGQEEKEKDRHDDALYEQSDTVSLPIATPDSLAKDDDGEIVEEEQEETSFGTSLAAFDTTVLEEKLSLQRNPAFVQMYHMTQHFDRGQEYRSKSERYVSWYKPVDILKKTTSAKRSKDKFFGEYEGKMNGLKKTADVLQNWSTTSSKEFGESCRKMIHIIQDITPTVWELGIMSSPFHVRRIKYGLPWDESKYLDVYKAAQDVAYVMCKRALDLTDADKESSSNKSFYLLMDATEAVFRIYNMCGGLDERVSSVCPAFMDRVNLYLHQKDPIWYRSRQN